MVSWLVMIMTVKNRVISLGCNENATRSGAFEEI